MTLQLGLDTFGDIQDASKDSKELTTAGQTIRNVIEQAQLADSIKVDAFGIGEHHRDDYAVSSPEPILAAIAATTKHIKMGTAVTVLSSDDPVRVYQRFATLQAISQGRAEVMLGRGSFIESFPLFGYELDDYETLYAEKLDLFAKLRKEEPVTWEGTIRTGLQNQHVYPKTEYAAIPTWVAVGGTPTSVVRAAAYGLPVAFAIIGGSPVRFQPLKDLYVRALEQAGFAEQPVAVHSMGHIADTDSQAREEYWDYYSTFHARLGRERGWGVLTKEAYINEIENGSLYVGSAETVAKKIVTLKDDLNIDRFDLKYATGRMPHSMLMKSIELFGTKVAETVKNS